MSTARLTQDNALHGSDKWLEFLATEQRAGRRDGAALAASVVAPAGPPRPVQRLPGARFAAAPLPRAAAASVSASMTASKVKAVYWANLAMVLLAWGLR
jgi:uncharacterized protein GlcG (DUF336 family)